MFQFSLFVHLFFLLLLQLLFVADDRIVLHLLIAPADVVAPDTMLSTSALVVASCHSWSVPATCSGKRVNVRLGCVFQDT